MTAAKGFNGGHPAGLTDHPTDMELMLFVDGELDDLRAKQVATFVERDSNCRQKVAALRLSSALVRHVASPSSSSSADDLADLIMARIARGDHSAARAEDAPADTKGSSKPPEVVRPLRSTTPNGAKPANDNSRTIFGLAALAVAAAAGFMIWGRIEPQPIPLATTTPAAVQQAAAPVVSELAPQDQQVAEAPAAESDSSLGVEVATVDFGSRVGTIFYVPKEADTSNHTTTVVWLNDDGSGGK